MNSFLKYFAAITLFIILSIFYIPSQANTKLPTQKSEKVILGIYIMQLYDLSLANKSFDTVFWLWSYSDDPNFRLKNNIDVMNARKTDIPITYSGKLADGRYWDTAKYYTNIIKHWDLSLFPFDKQVLQIVFESAKKQFPDLIYTADKINTTIDPEIVLDDWKIIKFEFIPLEKSYTSNFLIPNKLTQSHYARMVANITIQRDGMRKFLQYLGVTYLACFIGLCIYLVPLRELAPRIGLLTASIFAAVGNKIMLEGALPTVNTLTLVDKIEIVVFIFLGYTLAFILLDNLLRINKHELLAIRINRYVFIFSIFYIIFTNIYIFLPVFKS